MGAVVLWTEIELQILEEGYAQGLSAGEIAEMLPGRSRHAVSNKAAQCDIRQPPKRAAAPTPEPWHDVIFPDEPKAWADHGSGGQRPVIDRTDVLRSSAGWFG